MKSYVGINLGAKLCILLSQSLLVLIS